MSQRVLRDSQADERWRSDAAVRQEVSKVPRQRQIAMQVLSRHGCSVLLTAQAILCWVGKGNGLGMQQ